MSVLAQSHSHPLDVVSDSEMNLAPHSPASKRKIPPSEERQHQSKTDVSKRVKEDPTTPAAKATPPSLVLLRNGKLILKQKAIEWSRSMSTLTTIIAFNTYLEQCNEPLTEIPEEHLHMIAKLTQESDKSLGDVAKNIKNLVLPAADEDGESEGTSADNVLTLSSITKAVEKVADRVNYGIDEGNAASISLQENIIVPPNLQLWRWEVRNFEQLAAENREKIIARREERIKAKAQAEQLLREMPVQERNSLLMTKKGSKSNTAVKAEEEQGQSTAASMPPDTSKKLSKLEAAIVIDDDDDDDDDDDNANRTLSVTDGFVTPSPKKKSVFASPAGSGVSKGTSSRGVSPTKGKGERKKATLSPEQEAKEAEKEEKRRQREIKRAEKERKEAEKEAKRKKEAQLKAKAASFMFSYIQKPRNTSPTKDEKKVATISDFDKAFLPCNYKDVAPINRFSSAKSSRSEVDHMDQDKRSAEELLQDFKTRYCPKKGDVLRSRTGIHPPISVRESMRLITEASVMNDEKLEENGKRGLSNLSDRKKVPMKLLHFSSDRRPAWYGTWTRTTNLVGPRNPLGQDSVALDYSYESDAEWEDEDPNDGDDLLENDDKEEEEGDRSGDESEMDDWLVDDYEEEDEEEGTAPPLIDDMEIVEVNAAGQPISTQPSKVTSKDVKTGGELVNFLQPRKKKIKSFGRRIEGKLVPFSTGPHWQDNLRETTYDGFKGYQIEFLNDAPVGLNPFTFQSTVELLPAVDIEMAPPSSIADSKSSLSMTCKGMTASIPALAKAQTFPNQHLPALLKMIEGSTSIRPILVEELKTKFASIEMGKVVTKANIDACLSVYAEKLSKKLGGKWAVKEEFRSMADMQQEMVVTAVAATQ